MSYRITTGTVDCSGNEAGKSLVMLIQSLFPLCLNMFLSI